MLSLNDMLKFYNSLAKKKQEFKPVNNRKARIYSCGPTVYDFAHIGNFRCYVFNDVLRRYLEYKGYEVQFVMNITDVDDKTIKNSKSAGKSSDPKQALKEFTQEYEKCFWEDMKALNNLKPSQITRAVEYIPQMKELVELINKNGYAYISEGSVYFDLEAYMKKHEYGKLLNIDLDNFKKGARISADEYEREQVQDFVLWKGFKDGEPHWDFMLDGKSLKGRPGWHIECSAMGYDVLGMPFDIHTGGIDLKFPHHENEIAQNSAGYGIETPVRFWVHNAYLMVEGRKMSKSLGNFYTLRDLISKGHTPREFRYVMIGAHYRQELDFRFSSLNDARNTLKRLDDFINMLKSSLSNGGESPCLDSDDISGIIEKVKSGFESAMDDDLNTPSALSAIFEFIKEINKASLSKESAKEVLELMKKFDSVLGILSVDSKKLFIADGSADDLKIKVLIEKRNKARQSKDYAKADKIRDELLSMGIEIRDAEGKTEWKH